MKNDFNPLALIYDRMARLVFGRSIVDAQIYFLHKIATGSKVLIVGGGSGWILEEMDKLNVSMYVCYAEPSLNMINIARNREPFSNLEVNFIAAGYETFDEEGPFDVIITNFFLDLFSPNHLYRIIQQLDHLLQSKGFWLATDFVNTNSQWQKWLIKAMYMFFRMTTGIEAKSLSDFIASFRQAGYSICDEKTFYHGMIKSWVLKR